MIGLRRAVTYLLLPVPLARWDWLVAAFITGIAIGCVATGLKLDVFDFRLYDRIVSHNLRPAAPNTIRVVVDPDIPVWIPRTQTIVLEALAAERLIKLGATKVYLDAEFVLRNYRKEKFLTCLPATDDLCNVHGDKPCLSEQGRPRLAPLDLDHDAKGRFFIPVPLSDSQPPAYSHLFGSATPPNLVMPTLPTSSDGIYRDAYADGDDTFLTALVNTLPENMRHRCPGQSDRMCMAIRFSQPGKNSILPLSRLASCNATDWQSLGPAVTGRIVVLQITNEQSPEDIHLTPLVATGNVTQGLISGSRLIAESIETGIQGDGPLSPPTMLLAVLFFLTTALTVATFAFIRTAYAIAGMSFVAGLAWLSAPLCYPYALWPATAWILALVVAALIVVVGHMWLNTRHSGMLARFMPRQIRHLLLTQRTNEFSGRELHAIVMVSDLAGYCTVTSLLPSAAALFDLINQYLATVTKGLQERYGAWLEAYVADMICYYWPQFDNLPATRHQLRVSALKAAMQMMDRQQVFFDKLPYTLPSSISQDAKQQISSILYAGVAMTEGSVFMGEQGPPDGIRRFGILGDPMNLASRLEALTRLFSARLIVTQELVTAGSDLGLRARRLAVVRVRNRPEPVAIWALHRPEDAISEIELTEWAIWLDSHESSTQVTQIISSRFSKDMATLNQWRSSGLWDEASKCYNLETK